MQQIPVRIHHRPHAFPPLAIRRSGDDSRSRVAKPVDLCVDVVGVEPDGDAARFRVVPCLRDSDRKPAERDDDERYGVFVGKAVAALETELLAVERCESLCVGGADDRERVAERDPRSLRS